MGGPAPHLPGLGGLPGVTAYGCSGGMGTQRTGPSPQQVDEVLGRQNRPLTGPPVRALRPQVAHPPSCLTLWDPPPATSLKPAGFSGLKGPGVTKGLEENECPSLVHWTSLMTNGKWSPPVSPLQTPDTQNEDRCGRFPPSSESGGWALMPLPARADS